jgi:RNA polymerase sigma-70 factor (ECF subfamily)
MTEPEARTDEQLMRACAAGDLGAFEILLGRYERRILSYAYRFLHDWDAARDIYQQTFLNIFQKRRQYRETARFSTYAYRIAHNLCQNELRRAEYRRTTSLERGVKVGDEAAGAAQWLSDGGDGPLEPLSRQEQDRLLHEAVAELDPMYREVIALRIFEGLAFKEIAEIAGVGESTIKSRMRYALAYLERALRGRVEP